MFTIFYYLIFEIVEYSLDSFYIFLEERQPDSFTNSEQKAYNWIGLQGIKFIQEQH